LLELHRPRQRVGGRPSGGRGAPRGLGRATNGYLRRDGVFSKTAAGFFCPGGRWAPARQPQSVPLGGRRFPGLIALSGRVRPRQRCRLKGGAEAHSKFRRFCRAFCFIFGAAIGNHKAACPRKWGFFLFYATKGALAGRQGTFRGVQIGGKCGGAESRGPPGKLWPQHWAGWGCTCGRRLLPFPMGCVGQVGRGGIDGGTRGLAGGPCLSGAGFRLRSKQRQVRGNRKTFGVVVFPGNGPRGRGATERLARNPNFERVVGDQRLMEIFYG